MPHKCTSRAAHASCGCATPTPEVSSESVVIPHPSRAKRIGNGSKTSTHVDDLVMMSRVASAAPELFREVLAKRVALFAAYTAVSAGIRTLAEAEAVRNKNK